MCYRNIIVLLFSVLVLVICDDSSDIKVLDKLNTQCSVEHDSTACLQRKALEGLIKVDEYEFAPGIGVARSSSKTTDRQGKQLTGDEEPNKYILNRVEGYLNTHVLNINLSRALDGWQSAVGYSHETREYYSVVL